MELAHRGQKPLRDASAVNSTRWALYQTLKKTGLKVEVGTGGRTKFNRQGLGIPKTHALDAACVGEVEIVEGWNVPTLAIKATTQGIPHRHCVLTQQADGYGYHIQPNQPKEKGDRENESR
jgi:hypothetical protein